MSVRPIAWTRNTMRNWWRGRMLGRALGWGAVPPLRRIRVVCATGVAGKAFWSRTPLGRSLAAWRADHRVVVDLTQEGAAPSAAWNAAIARAQPDEALLFVSDTAQLADPRWIDKLLQALQVHDVVGVAGRRHAAPRGGRDAPPCDAGALGTASGGGTPSQVVYGPATVRCRSLEGPLLAARADLLQRWQLGFDAGAPTAPGPAFCQAARQAGCSLGVWPIDVVAHA